MKQKLDFIITSNEALNEKTFLLKVSPVDGETLQEVYPGQFVQILIADSSALFLRRPISINYIDKETNEMWLLIQNVGKGTNKITEMKVGEELNLLFPLGNSFTMPQSDQRVLLIGGGVGTAAILFLGTRLQEKGFKPEFLLCGRSASDITQLDDFEKTGTVHITTEDGSLGVKGLVTHHPILKESNIDRIYTCGPKPMMIAIAQHATDNEIACEASLENHMPCGFGVCLCCVEKTKERGNVCVCTEGPVFNINELQWIH